MKKILITLFCICYYALSTNAQQLVISDTISLNTPNDYVRYQDLVISSVDWLVDSKLTENINQRKRVNSFLLKWLSGSPKIQVKINPEIVTFMSSSPEFIPIYLGGWARYAINNDDYNNDFEGIKAGLTAVNKVYRANSDSIEKDDNIEQLIRLEDEGKLDNYIQENLHKKD